VTHNKTSIRTTLVTASVAAIAVAAFTLSGPAFASSSTETLNETQNVLVKAMRKKQEVDMRTYREELHSCSQCLYTGQSNPVSSPMHVGTQHVSVDGGGSGVSGAATLEGIGVWAAVSYTQFEDDLRTTAMDGHTVSGFVGIDKQFTDKLVIGLSLGRDDTALTTLFNSGNMDSEGITVAPYVAYELSSYFPSLPFDSLTADASLGFSKIDIDTERQLVGGGVVLGDTDTTRKFATATLTASKWFDALNVSGNVGYLRSHDTTDSYRESFSVSAANAVVGGAVVPSSESDLGQWNVGIRASYWTQWAQPFLKATYEIDQNHSNVRRPNPNLPNPENDDDGFVLGGGLTFSLLDWLSGSVEASTVQDRADFNSWTASGNLRIAL
jgi:hypothetical protein